MPEPESAAWVVDRVPMDPPKDDGPHRQFWNPVYLLLWSDGSVTWEVDDER